MTSKTTKRALLMSVVSMLLCMTMLVGSTFAWFTDSATTSVNKIVSGTLDVALEMLVDGEWVSAEGKTLDFVKAEGAEDEDILWEPGCTYQLPQLRVVNKGNLWLKYQIVITGIEGDAKLNEAIEWSFSGAKGSAALQPQGATEAITISGHMKEEAGNEYQDLTIDGISITVLATQYTYEHDSFDDQYDAKATYTAAKVSKIPAEQLTVNTNNGALKLDTGYTFETTDAPEVVKDSAYANWHADFVVTLDKAVPAGALTLAGQYDSWSTDWVAFANPDAIDANDEIRLLETAGVSVNYYELCSLVKEFNCGAVGAGLEGTTMTVELRLYETKDPADTANNSANEETGEYILIGSYTHTFGNNAPTASVSQIPAEDLEINQYVTLDAGYTFTAVESAAEAAASVYKNWHADFVVSVDQNVGACKLTVAGQYDSWSQDWMYINIGHDIAANEEFRLLGSYGLSVNYNELCTQVKEFNCGVDGNGMDGITITVELRLYETEAPSAANGNSTNVETGNYIVIGTYSYTF